MLDNIKGLLRVKEEVDAINTKLDSTKEQLQQMQESLSSFHKELTETQRLHSVMLTDVKEEFSALKEFRVAIENELYEFKLLKNDLQRKILKKFEEELNAELSDQMKTLGQEATNYEELKQKLADTSKRTDVVAKEMDKWLEISRNVKAKDFELETFAKELIKLDKDKLGLLRKIDSLERTMASMQRRR